MKPQTNEQATEIMRIEIERTSAGWMMFNQGIPVDEIRQRVKVRVENFDPERGAGDVWISVDGSEWVKDNDDLQYRID